MRRANRAAVGERRRRGVDDGEEWTTATSGDVGDERGRRRVAASTSEREGRP